MSNSPTSDLVQQIQEAKRSKTVRLSTPMVKGQGLPTLTKTKGMFALLMLAEANTSPKPGEIYEVSVEVLRDLLNCRDDTHLRSELEGLKDLNLDWEKFDKGARGFSRPVSSCKWLENGHITFAFDPQFVVAWQDNSIGFKRISFISLSEFTSVYSAKLYEISAFYYQPGKTTTTTKMTRTEIRELFGVRAGQYPGGTFRQSVIAVAEKAVNAAKLGFTVAYKSVGRGETGRHWFEISDGPTQQRLPLAPIKRVSGSSLYDRIVTKIASVSESRRIEIEEFMIKVGYNKIPENTDEMNLKIYASRLREIDVDVRDPDNKS